MNIEATPTKCKSDTSSFLVVLLKNKSIYLQLRKNAYSLILYDDSTSIIQSTILALSWLVMTWLFNASETSELLSMRVDKIYSE